MATVDDVTKRVIECNDPYYDKSLSSLIPEDLLNTVLTNDNLFEIEYKIDAIRFTKTAELVQLRGTDTTETCNAINESTAAHTLLPPEQEKIKRSIKFLLNVACVVIHW
ncbi:MAG: hypothetical protein Q8Q23_05545 [bacterium]|nr:hypothetical protein [bacterium]